MEFKYNVTLKDETKNRLITYLADSFSVDENRILRVRSKDCGDTTVTIKNNERLIVEEVFSESDFEETPELENIDDTSHGSIYVLKTKDQYRVALLFNPEYMNYSIADECYKDEIVPSRVVELWGYSKFTYKEDVALHLAHNWASNNPLSERGVIVVKVNKTWKQLMKDAALVAGKEIDCIKKAGTEKYWDMELLQKIADGNYLSEWLHRKRYNKDLKKHNCGYWSVCTIRECPCTKDKNTNSFDNEIYSTFAEKGSL